MHNSMLKHSQEVNITFLLHILIFILSKIVKLQFIFSKHLLIQHLSHIFKYNNS